jgi:hypothetical protein
VAVTRQLSKPVTDLPLVVVMVVMVVVVVRMALAILL